MPSVTPGRYRHFKGKLYRVLCVARHSETEERLVIYHPEDQPESLWARPEAMFTEEVDSPAGQVPRFAPIDLELAAENHVW